MPLNENDLDKLYAAPLEQFIHERDALADRLRQSGEGASAAAVKRLKKPSRTAWAVNQAARKHPDEMTALLDAGAELRAAQQAALQGGDAAALRSATEQERHLVNLLIDRAARLASGGREPDPATVRRIQVNLHAGANGPDEVRARLQRGRLTDDLAPAGFAEAFATGAAAAASSPPAKARAAASRAELDRARKQLDKARREAKKRREQANAAERAAAKVRDAAHKADRASEQARARADEAEAAVRAAEEQLAQLERD